MRPPVELNKTTTQCIHPYIRKGYYVGIPRDVYVCVICGEQRSAAAGMNLSGAALRLLAYSAGNSYTLIPLHAVTLFPARGDAIPATSWAYADVPRRAWTRRTEFSGRAIRRLWRGAECFRLGYDVAVRSAAKTFRGKPSSRLAINAYAYPLVSFFKYLHLISALKLRNDFSAGLIPDVELVGAHVLVGWCSYWRGRCSRCGCRFTRCAEGCGLSLRCRSFLFPDCPQHGEQDQKRDKPRSRFLAHIHCSQRKRYIRYFAMGLILATHRELRRVFVICFKY